MKQAAALVCGGVLAFVLPSEAPAVAADVVTRSVGRGFMAGRQAGYADVLAKLDRLDEDPQAMLGKPVSVRGRWRPASNRAQAAVFERVSSCCAADAVAVGFDVEPAGVPRALEGETVRVRGILRARLHDGEIRYVIESAAVDLLAR